MDIAEIADRTGIAVRQVRYVIDHGLLPITDHSGPGRGIAREFNRREAFGIACSALLRAAGLRRQIVADCAQLLMDPATGREPIILRIEPGSGVWLRSQASQYKASLPHLAVSKEAGVTTVGVTGATAIPVGQQPLVATELDLQGLWERLDE